MPIDPITGGALIQGATGLIGGLFGRQSTKEQNRASRQFAIDRYGVERQDNLEFWKMQNEYNSPSQQRKRLQAAGLSPALMYGGSGGGGVAASQINTPDTQSAQFREVPTDFIGKSIGGYFDTRIKQAQYSNLLTHNTVELEQAALLQAKRIGEVTSNKRGKINHKIEQELYRINAIARERGYNKISEIDTALTKGQSRWESGSRMELNDKKKQLIEQQLKNLSRDNEIKKLQIALKGIGLNESDPWYYRILAQAFDKYKN